VSFSVNKEQHIIEYALSGCESTKQGGTAGNDIIPVPANVGAGLFYLEAKQIFTVN
jgi:hypothetical protein